MNRTRSSVVLLSVAMLVGVGCKKKPVGENTINTVTEAPPEAAKPEAPAEVKQMIQNFQRVYFDFDSTTLANDARAALDDNVVIMQSNTDIRIEIQGHADERGSTDYNMALGQKRAEAVTRYMQSKGIASSRIKVVSYGEERPLDGSNGERAWTKNRRAEFAIDWAGEAQVQGTTGS